MVKVYEKGVWEYLDEIIWEGMLRIFRQNGSSGHCKYFIGFLLRIQSRI